MQSFFFMKKRIIGYFVLAALIISFTPAFGETLIWAVADRPTSYILKGPDKGRGAVDEVYTLLQKEITDYDHKRKVMTFGRILEIMKSGKNLCAVGFKKPEREAVGYFSMPAIIALPFSIVSKKGRLEKIYGDADSISLEEIVNRKDLKGAIMQKRSYGELNPLIKSYEDKNLLYVPSAGSDIVKMLLKGRFDYIIEIVSFVKYGAKQIDRDDEITSFSIREYTKPLLVAHVFCTKNEWGKNMIQKIDAILKKEVPTPEYREIIERWYDEKSKKIIRKHYDTVYMIEK